MTGGVDIDPVLDYLGPRGRFQLWQMMLVSMGGMCAQNQLFSIIFTGRDVPFRCAAPNVTNVTSILPDLPDVTATSEVLYEECNIIVNNNVSNDVRQTTYDCVYGYEYDLDIDASFMSEFGLVCDRYVLVSLSQTILVLGQGFGAFGSSIISDRFGRKPVLIGSQLGLLLVGVAIGAAPVYPALVIFKFLVGACQQGVVACISTLGIELYPRQYRSLSALIIAVWWAMGGCSMALYAFLLQHHSWRVLQYSLSSISLLIMLLQLLLMEESLRWLAANGRKKEVLRVLKRAARANRKIEGQVLSTLHHCQQQQHSGAGNDDAILRSVDHLFPPATHRPVSLVIEERNWQGANGGEGDEVTEMGAGRTELSAGSSRDGEEGSGGDGSSTGENSSAGKKELNLGAVEAGAGEKGLSPNAVEADSEREEELSSTTEESDSEGKKELSAKTAETDSNGEKGLSTKTREDDGAGENALTGSAAASEEGQRGQNGVTEEEEGEKELSLEATRHLTLLDMFRNKTLCFNALLTFFAWFTVAFVVFTLFLMSTSYAGDSYLNYFLAALMEAPPAFLLYFGVDRLGRKLTVQGLFAVGGVGCLASAVCLMFSGNAILSRMSSVFAMVGMLGGSGAFSGLFFYTPEYFPTNLRNQALGMASSVGRIGGMIAPFMKNLSLTAMWGPGIISGCLCVLVVICLYFLPETKGRRLPTSIEDIEAWYSSPGPKDRPPAAKLN